MIRRSGHNAPVGREPAVPLGAGRPDWLLSAAEYDDLQADFAAACLDPFATARLATTVSADADHALTKIVKDVWRRKTVKDCLRRVVEAHIPVAGDAGDEDSAAPAQIAPPLSLSWPRLESRDRDFAFGLAGLVRNDVAHRRARSPDVDVAAPTTAPRGFDVSAPVLFLVVALTLAGLGLIGLQQFGIGPQLADTIRAASELSEASP